MGSSRWGIGLSLGIMFLAILQLNCLPTGMDRHIGVLGPHHQADGVLAAPETVQVGRRFAVTVTTIGSSSCVEADGADVAVNGLVAEIVPYDLDYTHGTCTMDYAPHPRLALLRFDKRGIGTVRVIGATWSGFMDTVTASVVVGP